jgi:hypothetical protein
MPSSALPGLCRAARYAESVCRLSGFACSVRVWLRDLLGINRQQAAPLSRRCNVGHVASSSGTSLGRVDVGLELLSPCGTTVSEPSAHVRVPRANHRRRSPPSARDRPDSSATLTIMPSNRDSYFALRRGKPCTQASIRHNQRPGIMREGWQAARGRDGPGGPGTVSGRGSSFGGGSRSVRCSACGRAGSHTCPVGAGMVPPKPVAAES